MENESDCDALLNDPALATPPSIPTPPPTRKPVFKKQIRYPERFPLISEHNYKTWVNHRKEVNGMKHFVNDKPPELFPEQYLKPRRLNLYAAQVEENMVVNKELLKRINYLTRSGGYVDCWQKKSTAHQNMGKLRFNQRQTELNQLQKENIFFYNRLTNARSDMPLTNELEDQWKETKKKLILGASLPFVLLKTEKIDRGIKDPSFVRPPGAYRSKVAMEIWVEGGSKCGRIFIELFEDITPRTCSLFLTLVNGDGFGHGYKGTSVFRIVPGLYCRAGDVDKNNGFGCYMEEGETTPMGAENFELRHTVPGVLSMAVTNQNEVCGQFNIIFKPLPQFNGKHVVFGKIVGGTTEILERISAIGRPLGSTQNNVVIRHCGSFNNRGRYVEGAASTIQFPPTSSRKK